MVVGVLDSLVNEKVQSFMVVFRQPPSDANHRVALAVNPNHGERSQWPVMRRHCQSRSRMIAGREKKGRVNYSRNSAMSTSCRVRMIFWKPATDNDRNQVPCYLKNNPHPMKNSPRLSTGGGELCYSPIKTSVGDSC